MFPLFFGILVLSTAILISTLICKLLKEAMLSELKRMRSVGQIPLKSQASNLRFVVACTALIFGVLGYVFFQRPISVVTGLAFGPLLFRLYAWVQIRARAAKFDEELLAVLITLRGMVRSGLSLTAALNLVVDDQYNEVAHHLSRYLKRFESGRSLNEVLNSFETRSGMQHTGPLFQVLGAVQNLGAGGGDLLDRMVETLQTTLEMERRIRGIRRSVLFQGVFAASMPWGILAFLKGTLPETGISPWLVLFCLCIQCVGGFLLWQVARFR